jgi:hypothetical protein
LLKIVGIQPPRSKGPAVVSGRGMAQRQSATHESAARTKNQVETQVALERVPVRRSLSDRDDQPETDAVQRAGGRQQDLSEVVTASGFVPIHVAPVPR